MKWFGAPWADYGIVMEQQPVPVPLGQPCALCDAPITADDRGVIVPHLTQYGWIDRPWHLTCFHNMLGCRCLSELKNGF